VEQSDQEKMIEEILNEHCTPEYRISSLGNLSKALSTYVTEQILEELKLAHGKESLNIYHNGAIRQLEWVEHRINELEQQGSKQLRG
jgi:hypothetical protein